MHNNKKAIVLLSGGLDSTTTLYWALDKGYRCHCLVFDYGQRHRREILAAKRICQRAGCSARVVKITLPHHGSSLLNRHMRLPQRPQGVLSEVEGRANAPTRKRANIIPNTYVPARNIIFLSLAASFAETQKAQAIFIGANAVDYSGYPDCRPEFFRQFIRAIAAGTKSGVEGKKIKIITPLIYKSKKEIVQTGQRLDVPFALTWSCYKGGRFPCGECDSCRLRQKGFREAGLKDPLYANVHEFITNRH
ncbi:MAG: 7-cyano-7-deazaguanine synthase QueC [Candidatus Omnitrophota bacterium]